MADAALALGVSLLCWTIIVAGVDVTVNGPEHVGYWRRLLVGDVAIMVLEQTTLVEAGKVPVSSAPLKFKPITELITVEVDVEPIRVVVAT